MDVLLYNILYYLQLFSFNRTQGIKSLNCSQSQKANACSCQGGQFVGGCFGPGHAEFPIKAIQIMLVILKTANLGLLPTSMHKAR